MSEEVKKEEVQTEATTQKTEVPEEVKNARVIQIIQSDKTGRIEIIPVQNIKFRSDIIGILVQALNNIQNEDIMRSEAALLKEAISLIKEPVTTKNTTVVEPTRPVAEETKSEA